jgi:predicted methyltransferase
MFKRYSYYKLIDGSIEVDGIRMHQTVKLTPFEDARNKVASIPIKKNYKVLDICTGLGYSAIEASKKADKVYTIDNDPYMHEMAKKNIASEMLFSSKNILKIIANAEDIIDCFPANYFDAIIHDPPRLKRAGFLYSQNFYNNLFKILKSNRYLFHYTGKPGEKLGKNIPKGVKKRLINAGFINVKWIEVALGLTGKKP